VSGRGRKDLAAPDRTPIFCAALASPHATTNPDRGNFNALVGKDDPINGKHEAEVGYDVLQTDITSRTIPRVGALFVWSGIPTTA